MGRLEGVRGLGSRLPVLHSKRHASLPVRGGGDGRAGASTARLAGPDSLGLRSPAPGTWRSRNPRRNGTEIRYHEQVRAPGPGGPRTRHEDFEADRRADLQGRGQAGSPGRGSIRGLRPGRWPPSMSPIAEASSWPLDRRLGGCVAWGRRHVGRGGASRRRKHGPWPFWPRLRSARSSPGGRLLRR